MNYVQKIIDENSNLPVTKEAELTSARHILDELIGIQHQMEQKIIGAGIGDEAFLASLQHENKILQGKYDYVFKILYEVKKICHDVRLTGIPSVMNEQTAKMRADLDAQMIIVKKIEELMGNEDTAIVAEDSTKSEV